MQFGHVKRATHRNTSWDKARFEASMHRWVDMSEADFGVALINDCKYGYDALEQLVRISLVRGSTHPDPDADQGEHRLRYGLYIHDGLADLAQVQRAAERFNNPVAVIGPVRSVKSASPTQSQSYVSVDAPNVTVETVKKAESSDALIVRVFEHANIRADATLRFGLPLKSVRMVNLMEENPGKSLPINDNAIALDLRPFEIVTLIIEVE
ncbi:glycoside hydrolase family 38 C-terminal domain-containing protein [Devosia algicola]|uniref:Glycoside hydrolase family 38 C-terminal domain-containing protein n=1 Tax=Devosia algicola TaxID=3026418 RepID=A0ABY7YTD5_9HYPH|nr:glycoside hydrolase family 38 C-terminal domain-containing protein [Devosia algicola]WDR04224.1 glycoside hydrolase family 38 C-terminal domain-containing protein [Devosia algicola]